MLNQIKTTAAKEAQEFDIQDCSRIQSVTRQKYLISNYGLKTNDEIVTSF